MIPYDEDTRRRVLSEHAILRVLIERLRQAAEKAQRGGLMQELRDAGRTLHFVLEAHTRVEEDLLGPALLASGGSRRLEELREGHTRALVELQRAWSRGPRKYAAVAARFAPHLLAALDDEERELFGAQVRPATASASRPGGPPPARCESRSARATNAPRPG